MRETLTLLVPLVITHLLVLVATIVVIKKMLLNDTMTAVNRIRQVETEVRKKEESIRKEIEEHEKTFAKQKADAEAELQRQRDTSEKELAKMRDQLIADAKKEADGLIEQARRNEEKFRKQIAQDMEGKAVDYGAQIFKLVFSEQMNEGLNKQFIGELLDAIEQIDSASITVDSKDAEFRSSHPIAADQKERMEKLLVEKFKVNIKVNEKVQPELLAGLVFKLGSMEIDGTLLNRYKEAVAEVKKSGGA